jgi:two-component system sensor histidine kinase KdpD
MTARRPDPDALLAQVREEQARERRGRLKLFFGASPGVGKTFTMLETARGKLIEGVDVVAGIVETHGREETRLLIEGLEILPRRTIDYRGTSIHEFDLDAALARHPGLLLVDELAHSNAPGSRHVKRWQDVEELLDAGVNVYTTLNVQHLESLNDVVAQITGVTVRETVPDSIFDRADEVELVDVSADVLQERLKRGKVYVAEQATLALDRFFRKGNLAALRELALRRTAERVDAQMRGYMVAEGIRETWPAGERILVCVGPNPATARLIRAGRRMAAGLRADWVAVYVETPAHQRLPAADRDAVAQNLRLAEQLGAQTVTLGGQSVSDEVLAYAGAHNITKIIVGKPTHARWRDKLRGSLLDALVRASGAIDVYVITGDSEEGRPRPELRPAPKSGLAEYAEAALIVLAATLFCVLLRPVFATIDVAMVYLLAVVVVATRHRQGPSIAASLLSIALLDFYFVPPFYTFSVSDTRYSLTFAVMFVIALVMSRLTARVRAQAQGAREREERTAALYAMSRELAANRRESDLIGVTLRHLRNTFASEVVLLLSDESGRLAVRGDGVSPAVLAEKERSVAQWVYDHGQIAGYGTSTLPGAELMYVPLTSSGRTLGVMGIRPSEPKRFRDPIQRQLLETFAGQAAAALERVALAEWNQRSQLEMEAERLRTSLLSSLSHDLRTPLADIERAAGLLVDDEALAPPARRELAGTVLGESRRMARLVTSLLEMIRLESGALQVQREVQPLDEVIGIALIRLGERSGDHPVTTSLPPDLPVVPIDGLLIEEVLINLLENAAQYAPPGTPIEVSATADPDAITVEVADRGPGLPPGEESRIFDGLGLTIARGIVKAHGGRIWAANRPGGGAAFRFTLPVAGLSPEGAAPAQAARSGQPAVGA